MHWTYIRCTGVHEVDLCYVYIPPPLISGSYIYSVLPNTGYKEWEVVCDTSLCTRWMVSSPLGSCRFWKQELMDGSVTGQTHTSWKSLMPKAREGTFLGRHIQTLTTMTSLTTSGRLREAMTASSCPGQWTGMYGDSPPCYMNAAGCALLFPIRHYLNYN